MIGEATGFDALAGSLALHARRRRRSKRSEPPSDPGELLSCRSGVDSVAAPSASSMAQKALMAFARKTPFPLSKRCHP